MESIFKTGNIIKCRQDLTSFCNGEEKIIFIKDKLYEVENNLGFPSIKIRDNNDGYTFFNNDKDHFFEVIGFFEDVKITTENISRDRRK